MTIIVVTPETLILTSFTSDHSTNHNDSFHLSSFVFSLFELFVLIRVPAFIEVIVTLLWLISVAFVALFKALAPSLLRSIIALSLSILHSFPFHSIVWYFFVFAPTFSSTFTSLFHIFLLCTFFFALLSLGLVPFGPSFFLLFNSSEFWLVCILQPDFFSIDCESLSMYLSDMVEVVIIGDESGFILVI